MITPVAPTILDLSYLALMDIRPHFEAELARRGHAFTIDAESGRHAIEIGGGRMLVSLDNIQRSVDGDGDLGRVARFVDAIEASVAEDTTVSAAGLYWSLEAADVADKADFRSPLSDLVDRLLVHLSSDGRLISWVTPDMLKQLGLTEAEASMIASDNLAQALGEAKLEAQDFDGVKLGWFETSFPFKASFILAPNLREKVESALEWPLFAVTPDRDFLYLWAARHTDFTGRVGGVVVDEYRKAAYPISTEVYKITSEAITAIGAFPS